MPVLGGTNPTGSGSGAVDTVNGQSGTVVLTAADLGAVVDRTDITGLTGGTATDLDSITTTSITVPYPVLILRIGNGEIWILESGTDAEDSANGIVRPDDYATTTNEKVWYARNW